MTRYLFVCALIVLCSCKQVRQMKSFSKCDFRLDRITDIELAGVNLSNVQSVEHLNFRQLTTISSAFLNDALDLNLIAHIEARNPNEKPASMNQFDWILEVNDKDVAKGSVEQTTTVMGGETEMITIPLSQNLSELFDSKQEMLDFALNITNNDGLPSNVAIRIRPSVSVAGKSIRYPGYITVREDFSSE